MINLIGLVLSNLKMRIRNSKQNRIHVLRIIKSRYVLIIAVLILLVFSKSILKLAFILLLILLGGITQIYKRFLPISIGLELITFIAIIVTIAINPLIGIISACIMILISHIVTSHICKFMFVKMLVYSFVCLVSIVIAPLGISSVGLIATVIINILYLVISLSLFANPRVWIDIPGNLINIAFNYFLFSNFGIYLLSFLTR